MKLHASKHEIHKINSSHNGNTKVYILKNVQINNTTLSSRNKTANEICSVI